MRKKCILASAALAVSLSAALIAQEPVVKTPKPTVPAGAPPSGTAVPAPTATPNGNSIPPIAGRPRYSTTEAPKPPSSDAPAPVRTPLPRR